MLLHVDLMELTKGKKVKMDIPVLTTGIAPGVANGGSLVLKNPKLKVLALPKDMPESITIDISELKMGKSIKVGTIETKDFEILTSPIVTVVTVAIPRALRGKTEEELEAEEAEAAEAAAEAGETPAAAE